MLHNLLHKFEQAGQLLPMAIEVSDTRNGSNPAPACFPYPLVQTGLSSIWNEDHPWRSLAGFCLAAPTMLWNLRSLCRQYSIRVLNPHFIGIEHFPLVLLRKLGLFRGTLILSFHGSDIRSMLQTQGIQRELFRILLRGADVLVSCSEGLREEILILVPECAKRTAVIPKGIDVAAFLS